MSFLVENKLEVSYKTAISAMADLIGREKRKQEIRFLRKVLDGVDDDFKSFRIAGEDLMRENEAVRLVQLHWPPVLVARLALCGVIENENERTILLQSSGIRQEGTIYKWNDYLSTIARGNEDGEYNRLWKFLAVHSLHVAFADKTNSTRSIQECTIPLTSFASEKLRWVLNMSRSGVGETGAIDILQTCLSRSTSVEFKDQNLIFTNANAFRDLQIGPYFDPSLRYKSTKVFDYCRECMSNNETCWDNSQFDFDRNEDDVLYAIKISRYIGGLTVKLAEELVRLASVRPATGDRLKRLRDEAKGPSNGHSDRMLTAKAVLDLTDGPLRSQFASAESPDSCMRVRSDAVARKSLFCDLLLSRYTEQKLVNKQRKTCVGYEDTVLITLSRMSGGLLVLYNDVDLFNMKRKGAQGLECQPTPGDVLDLYCFAYALAEGRRSPRGMMERANSCFELAEMYYKRDLAVFASKGGSYRLSDICRNAYEPRPYAIREMLCELARGGAEIHAEISVCWWEAENWYAKQILFSAGKDGRYENTKICIDKVIQANGIIRRGNFAKLGSDRKVRVTTSVDHVHHLGEISKRKGSMAKASELHGAIAGEPNT